MADVDKDQKTEEATSKRIDQEFKKGNFAKAPEIQMTFMMIAAFFVVLFLGGSGSRKMADATIELLGHLGEIEVSIENCKDWLIWSYGKILAIVVPVIVACTGASIIAAGLQSGFKLTPEVLAWKPEKLNPVTGLKNLFSKSKITDFLVEFLKLAAVVIIVTQGIWVILDDPIFHTAVTPAYTLKFIHKLFLTLFLRLIFALSVIAIIHFLFQKRKTSQDLKMTKQEVKDERKSQEGDPAVKGRQRQFMRSMLRRQMMSAIPEADVVVTNPTHYAVALKYERGVDQAPVIVAKGQNLIAQKIKAIAREHGVPMVENRPVAQMLFKMGRVGSAIPYEMYQVVAEILAATYKSHRYYFHQLKIRRAQRQLQTKS